MAAGVCKASNIEENRGMRDNTIRSSGWQKTCCVVSVYCIRLSMARMASEVYMKHASEKIGNISEEDIGAIKGAAFGALSETKLESALRPWMKRREGEAIILRRAFTLVGGWERYARMCTQPWIVMEEEKATPAKLSSKERKPSITLRYGEIV